MRKQVLNLTVLAAVTFLAANAQMTNTDEATLLV